MYQKLENMICDELEEISNDGKLTAGNVELVDKLTHALKSIKTITAMQEHGYSGRRYYDRYDRYSRDNMRENMINEIRGIMKTATDEKTRQEFHRFIQKLEDM